MADFNTYLQPNERPVIEPTSDEKNIAMLAHLLTFFSSVIGPLIIYLIKKDDSPFIAAHAKAALNFQLSLIIYSIVGWILIFLLIGLLLLPLLGIFAVVFTIIAAIAAHDGKLYKYPFAITFLS